MKNGISRMNNKVEIWKRKLAKEKLKQQNKLWEELKRDHSLPKFNNLEDLYRLFLL